MVKRPTKPLLYHFLDAHYGVEDIERQRLKLSHVDRLNDPFEHRAIELRDRMQRDAFHAAIVESARLHGIICFSKTFYSPIMWSHYAERHKGICLGFEVRDVPLTEIRYIPKRLRGEITANPRSSRYEQRLMLDITRCKHVEWRYEKEVRLTARLEGMTREGSLYFIPFSNQLILRQVIVGAESKISRARVEQALGPGLSHVEAFQVRPAFKSFQMVRNKNESMWA